VKTAEGLFRVQEVMHYILQVLEPEIQQEITKEPQRQEDQKHLIRPILER